MAKQSTAAAARTRSKGNTSRPKRGRPAAASKKSNLHPIKWDIPFSNVNLIVLAIGIVVIVVGYLLMSTGINDESGSLHGTWNNSLAVNVAPIVLAIGYCVIVPIGILYRRRRSLESDMSEEGGAA